MVMMGLRREEINRWRSEVEKKKRVQKLEAEANFRDHIYRIGKT